ncbi:6-pyruvoyl trahydropterin synthase family protein [Streptomyces sp. NPDC049936]|uniref:6-pyruvoyl trahydropterin synthase family protein n=1 Tax=Streptomyces sp. NPDC049936 TaxID=3365599 RepID=UPI0037A59FC7
MTLRIVKRFDFSASHRLGGLPESHQCARLHGHNYAVELELSAERNALTSTGFVRDYGDLSAFKKWLDETLDHRHLNDVVEGNPTAENLAVWMFGQWKDEFPELSSVRVSETPKTWAEYRP